MIRSELTMQSYDPGWCCSKNMDGCWSSLLFLLALKSWVSTTAKISEMRRSRRSRWCQDVYHRIYLDVYHRKMKNMMMLVMMMMMVSWIHHEVIILRQLLPVEDRDPWSFPWRIGTRGRSGPITNAQCTANTSYIWWNNLDFHFSHHNCTYCTTSV